MAAPDRLISLRADILDSPFVREPSDRSLLYAARHAKAKPVAKPTVTEIAPGKAITPHGVITAPYVVRATEAYTGTIHGLRRTVAPIYSLAIATEPLPDEVWAELNLATRPAFNDLRHVRVWGQRTATGRIVFGGRGAPYHFGSLIRARYDTHEHIHQGLQQALIDLFPQLSTVRVTHKWGGPVAIPRDWHPSVGLDHASGLAWTGPYVGDGVATSNLAGRIIRDLILERDTDLTTLPITNHRSPKWEPEPIRWIGINAGIRVMGSADRSEARHARPSRRARMFGKLIGGH
ncbi:MAG: FAD-dependent oxidoreductase [Actinophytocola sp.]|nr:FAD-dependent oxidoreductase [Actinophytocola sp.]